MSDAKLVRAADSTLVVIDVQERLAAAMPSRDSILRATGILLEAATRLSVPIMITEQYPKGLGRTLSELTSKIPDTAIKVEKTCFSASPVLTLTRPQVVLAGMETHVCVLQTALELSTMGHEVFVVADAVCSRTDANHANAISRLQSQGVTITNTESVLFEWLRDAAHDQFRTISRLIR